MNLEIDMIARYVARLLGAAAPDAGGRPDAMSPPPHILIVEAPLLRPYRAALRRGAERRSAAAGATHDSDRGAGRVRDPGRDRRWPRGPATGSTGLSRSAA